MNQKGKNLLILVLVLANFTMASVIVLGLCFFRKSEIQIMNSNELEKIFKFGDIVNSPFVFGGDRNSIFIFSSSLGKIKKLGLRSGVPVWHYDNKFEGNVRFLKDESGEIATREYSPPKFLMHFPEYKYLNEDNKRSYYLLEIQNASGEIFNIFFFRNMISQMVLPLRNV